MSRLFSGWRALAGIVISALLLGVYARGGWGFVLGFVALVPWVIGLQSCTRLRGSLLSAWAMSIVFVLTTFSWFAVAIALISVCRHWSRYWFWSSLRPSCSRSSSHTH